MSFSSRMPAKAMRVPGIRCIGFLMYSAKVASFQVMPEVLLASE